jgi:hypothetical protein
VGILLLDRYIARTVAAPVLAVVAGVVLSCHLIGGSMAVSLIAGAAFAFAASASLFSGLATRREAIAMIAGGIRPLRIPLALVASSALLAVLLPFLWTPPARISVADWLRGLAFSALIPLCCAAAFPYAVIVARNARGDIWGPMLLGMMVLGLACGIAGVTQHSGFVSYEVLVASLVALTVGLYRVLRL